MHIPNLKSRFSRLTICFGAPILLFFVLIGVRQQQQAAYLYRDYAVNPTTGKYDRSLEHWLLPITQSHGDEVSVKMGSMTGAAEPVEEDVLWALSPTLRMHPSAETFIVSWDMQCCTDGGTSDSGQEIIYHRDSGEVFYHSKGTDRGKPYDETRQIAKGVDDSHIHQTAARDGGYDDL